MKKYRKLEKIYSKIPEIECKGLCHSTCSIVLPAKIEIKRAKERMVGKNPFNLIKARESLENGIIPACVALKDKRCSIYTARPAICRLYGVAEGLECPFGCVKKGKISRVEAHTILKEIEQL